MIMAKMKSYQVNVRDEGLDDYKQPLNTYSSFGTVDICISLLKQENVQDPRYKNATHLGLTTNKSLTDSMQIVDGSIKYKVLLINPDGRLSQLILQQE